MLSQLQSLIALVLIAFAAYGLGNGLLRGLRVHVHDRLSDFIFSISLGLIAVGTVLAVLGLVGLLYAPLIGVLTLALAFWTVGMTLQSRHAPSEIAADEMDVDLDPLETSNDAPSNGLLWFAASISVVAALGALVGAAAPTTAGDALCYHLELPKAFLADNRLSFYPYSENSTFPLLVEMWFLWAIALDGPVAAGLVHWLLGLIFADRPLCLPHRSWDAGGAGWLAASRCSCRA
jgi:hypothetical protein